MYLMGPAEDIFQEIGQASIAITPHRFPPALKNAEAYGIYNVGLVYFRRDANGSACLQWWRERCLEWCYDYLEGDRFADQKYLNHWPTKFSNVKIIEHPGINLAPWNLSGYQLTLRNGKVYTDDHPVLLYHFHGLKQVSRRIYDPQLGRYFVKRRGILQHAIYLPYLRKLGDLARTLGLKKAFTAPRTIVNDKSSLLSRRSDLKHSLITDEFFISRPKVTLDLGVILYISDDIDLLDRYLDDLIRWGSQVKQLVIIISSSSTRQVTHILNMVGNLDLPTPPLVFTRVLEVYQAWNFGIRQLKTKYCYLSTLEDQLTKAGVQCLFKAAESRKADAIYSTYVTNESFQRNFASFPQPEISATQSERPKPSLLTAFYYATHKAPRCVPHRLYRTDFLRKLPFSASQNNNPLSWDLYRHIHETLITGRTYYLHNPEAPEGFEVRAREERGEPEELPMKLAFANRPNDQLATLLYHLVVRWEKQNAPLVMLLYELVMKWAKREDCTRILININIVVADLLAEYSCSQALRHREKLIEQVN
jgi:hypothetical protein